MTKLFFGGFPLEYDEMNIVQLIAPYGDVSTIKIVRDRRTGKCKGYAFIEMAESDAAARVVIALNGAELDGRLLTVNVNTEEQRVPKAPVYRRVANRSSPAPYKRPRSNR